MSIFKSVGNALGKITGFGSAGRVDAQTTDPTMYKELYEQALSGMQGVGQDEASKGNREKIQGSLGGMLAGLEDNSAARKANFQEDMARGFQADAQSLARAKGGTGSLQQALRPSGAMYDSQARARSRGLTDLYGQGVQDLSNLQGVQGNMFEQDMSKARGVGDLAMKELAMRRGTVSDNASAQRDANEATYNRRMGTIGAIGKGVGAVASPHTTAGKMFGGGGF